MTIEQIQPIETWKALKSNPRSMLVDVRTNAEFDFTGIVDLRDLKKEPILLPIRQYPDMSIDNEFSNKLENIISSKLPNQKSEELEVFFLCRSGVRSNEAAKLFSQLDYKCFNIQNGFEGSINKNSHRGQVNGWKADGLPWRQN